MYHRKDIIAWPSVSSGTGGFFMKDCHKCHTGKPLSDYHNYRHSKDGKYHICKECRKPDSKKYYWENAEKLRQINREYISTPEGKKKNRLRVSAWLKANKDTESFKENRARKDRLRRDKYPHKYFARYKVMSAVKKGLMKKEPCEKCGSVKVQAHHDDYNAPYEVRWLCQKHHHAEHNNMDFKSEFNI